MCTVDNCAKPVLAKQMCRLHYKRMYHTGTTDSLREYHYSYRTPEHTAWRNMIDRCSNPKRKEYHRYGGRGIRVCEAWQKSFLVFLADMGHKPSPSHSIERIDNNKGYSPDNCRWATSVEQQNNKHNNKLLTFQNRTMTMSEWASEVGININTLKTRLNLYHWSIDRALQPKDYRRKYSHA